MEKNKNSKYLCENITLITFQTAGIYNYCFVDGSNLPVDDLEVVECGE